MMDGFERTSLVEEAKFVERTKVFRRRRRFFVFANVAKFRPRLGRGSSNFTYLSLEWRGGPAAESVL